VVEAMAAGAVPVVFAAGGPAEIVEDGVTGLLAEPGDAGSLAGALARMLHDAELRDSCRRHAQLQSARYDYRRTVYKTLDVYRRLCHVEPPLEGIPNS